MKKILLVFAMTLSMVVVVSQTVPREMVALEIGTGTWCGYCPGAAMGADDLLENGCKVAVVENHNGDAFANQYSNARNSYYAISGYPTAKFDGVQTVVGGNHTSSMYGSYLPKYNQRIAIPSNVAMTMDVSNSGLDYTVVINMEEIGALPGDIMKLRFCVTVSHINYNWQGQNHLNFVNVLMVPDATGTTVDFSGSPQQTVTLNFAMDPTWNLVDCEFVAFLQYDNNKEIMQTVKRGVVDLTVDFEASETYIDKNTVVNFTNNTFGGYIGVPETYKWFFPGAEPDFSTEENPTVTYTQCGTYDVTLIVDRGGQIDTVVKESYMQVGPMAVITASPDDTVCWYTPVTLDATNPDAVSYLWEPGGATTPSITVLSSEVGTGAHTFSVTLTSAGGCENTGTHTIFFDECVGMEDPASSFITTLSPNPSNGRFVLEFTRPVSSLVDIRILSSTGNIVHEQTGIRMNQQTSKAFNLDLPAGIYFLVVKSNGEQSVQKLVITH